jgi:large subunit ribosomal protein L31
MKASIHPKWYAQARVVCACGNTFTVGATVPDISTEVCANCHPFFTGEQRIVDTAGQVDRFMRRLEAGVQQRQVAHQRLVSRAEAERQAKLQRRGLAPVRPRKAAGGASSGPAAPAQGEDAPEGATEAEAAVVTEVD